MLMFLLSFDGLTPIRPTYMLFCTERCILYIKPWYLEGFGGQPALQPDPEAVWAFCGDLLGWARRGGFPSG